MSRVAPKKTTMPIQSEYDAQKAVFEWAEKMESKYPELWLLNGSLNGVRLTMGQAVKAKKAGMKKGFPDIFFPLSMIALNADGGRAGIWCGLFIELKKEKGGRATPEQKEWLNELKNQGYYTCICKGKEAAIRVITQYLEGEL